MSENLFQTFQNAINLIEDHLLDPNLFILLESNPFFRINHLQRAFKDISGITISQYIKYRRLSVIGLEIYTSRHYTRKEFKSAGFSSNKAFEKAFKDFHGYLPKELTDGKNAPKVFSRFNIRINITGGDPFNYSVSHHEQFSVYGADHHFSYESSREEIPELFVKTAKKYSGLTLFSIARASNEIDEFDYFLGTPEYEKAIDALDSFIIPSSKYLIFKIEGQYPDVNFAVRKRIFDEVLPGLYMYRLTSTMFIEKYYPGDPLSDSYKSEIWIPVEDIKEED